MFTADMSLDEAHAHYDDLIVRSRQTRETRTASEQLALDREDLAERIDELGGTVPA